MHDTLTIGLPILAILAGILLNRQDVSGLRTEVNGLRNDLHSEINGLRNDLHSETNSLRSEMNSRFDSIQRDMREFYAEQARHDVRLTRIEQTK